MFGKRRGCELYIWENLIWKNVELETCIFGKIQLEKIFGIKLSFENL